MGKAYTPNIKSDKGKISLAKIVGAGVFLAFGLSAWGGAQFFIFPIGFFFMALPFLLKKKVFFLNWIQSFLLYIQQLIG